MYSLFDRINSIPYLTMIRNKEWSNVFAPYSLFYNIDVTLERQLRKLYVSTRTAVVFTRKMNNWIKRHLATLRES